MKLRSSPTSPYVRKVLVTLAETGQEDSVEAIATNPWDPATDLPRFNPLGKVPALILDDGMVLVDSPAICEYLDSLHDGERLFPAAGTARWRTLRQQALADGILDAAILRLLEGRRPEGEKSESWIDRQKASVARSLDILEAEAVDPAGPPTIGSIALGCALGYLDFRFGDDNWRDGRPGLAAWYEGFAARPSMQATVPADPPG